ncbi:Uncharacterized protein Adt_09598 [Abeliophyllum distichum]|uniref:Uncharacterized protein n=1 Tax=Abeliophyllum distichum TaxID=126358 RepID=A0ABD1UHL9_9LAMI
MLNYILVAQEKEEEAEKDVLAEEEDIGVMQISLDALMGTFIHKTIRIPGKVRGRNISILIDSGSTHSFIDDKLSILVQQPYGLVGQLNTILEEEVTEIPEELKPILIEFDDVFQEPKGLPPERLHDHHIPLKKGAQPFQIRPYRCPFIKKSEVETLIEEMLATGII